MIEVTGEEKSVVEEMTKEKMKEMAEVIEGAMNVMRGEKDVMTIMTKLSLKETIDTMIIGGMINASIDLEMTN